MRISEEPGGPIAGVAGPGELPGGSAGCGWAREPSGNNGPQSTFGAMAEPDVPEVLDDRRRTAFADVSEAPGDPGPAETGAADQ